MSKSPKSTEIKTEQPTELSDEDLDQASGGNWMKKAQQAAQMVSETSKNVHDTTMSVIRKI